MTWKASVMCSWLMIYEIAGMTPGTCCELLLFPACIRYHVNFLHSAHTSNLLSEHLYLIYLLVSSKYYCRGTKHYDIIGRAVVDFFSTNNNVQLTLICKFLNKLKLI